MLSDQILAYDGLAPVVICRSGIDGSGAVPVSPAFQTINDFTDDGTGLVVSGSLTAGEPGLFRVRYGDTSAARIATGLFDESAVLADGTVLAEACEKSVRDGCHSIRPVGKA